MKVTIQRTSKKLKAWLLLSNVVQLLAILLIILLACNNGNITVGFAFLGIGIAMHVVGRVLIWWNHD